MIIDIDPTIIYFTHSRIRKSFTGCNKTLNDTLQEIINSKIKPSDLPIITVYYDGTNYFSQNNRRLWILKECIKLKLIDNIKVLIKKIGNKRYITSNCSLTHKQSMN